MRKLTMRERSTWDADAPVVGTLHCSDDESLEEQAKIWFRNLDEKITPHELRDIVLYSSREAFDGRAYTRKIAE